MDILDKTITVVTGKSKTERLQEKAANRQIRSKIMAARFKEREKQQIRLAKEKERISVDRRLKIMKEGPKQQDLFGLVKSQSKAKPSKKFNPITGEYT